VDLGVPMVQGEGTNSTSWKNVSPRVAEDTCFIANTENTTFSVQRQLFLPVGDNYFSPLPLVNKGRDGE
jgi:hypothetical protein